MIPELLRQQIVEGEGLHTEFMADAGHLEAVAETVCAFLNSQGGTVFCGVDHAGQILGLTSDAQSVSAVHEALLPMLTPAPLFSVSVDDVDGKSVLTVEVPEGKDRPYVCNGRVFVRLGPRTVAADAAALREMVQIKAVSVERWERRPSMAMEDDDLDRDEVQAMVREAGESGRFRFEKSDDHDAVLAALGLYSAKRYTQAADVLFARNPAIRHPQTRVRVTRFEAGKTGDRYLDDRQLQGPLVQVFYKVVDWINEQLPREQRFSPGQQTREARLPYPAEAIREGLVNAFAHRDYAGFTGGMTVGVHDSRIEIWNSGRLPDGLKPGDLRRNHPSLPTNPDMAQVLYLRGLMERIGRGTQKIVQACEDLGLRPPQWDDRPTGVTLTLFGPTDPGADLDALNARQQALLAALKVEDRLRPMDYRARFAPEVSERQARRDLDTLEKLGLLRKEGGGATTTYLRVNRTLRDINRT